MATDDEAERGESGNGLIAQPSGWGIGYALAVLAAVAAVFVTFHFGGQRFIRGATGASIRFLASTIAPSVVAIFLSIRVAKNRGRGVAEDLGLRVTAKDLQLGLGIAGAGFFGALVAVLLHGAIFALPELQRSATAETAAVRVAVLVSALDNVTVAPLAEEVFFRGLWWTALQKYLRRPWFLNVAIAGMFSALHFSTELAVVYFVYGLVLGFGRMKTRRIGASVIAHAVLNLPASIITVASTAQG